MERFFAQVREDTLLVLVVLLMAVGGSIWSDLASDWWDDMPFVSNLISSILLLGFTLLLVEEYLKWRAAEAWRSVAAFALEDLARVARAVWVQQASAIAPLQEPMPIGSYRRFLVGAAGRKHLEDGLERAFLFEGSRERLFDASRETARRTREIIISWSPTLVPHAQLAPYLAELATLHRTMVQVLRVMSIKRQGSEPPVGDKQLREWITDVIYVAMALDERLHREAGETDSLGDYAFETSDL